jgi:hypothetical protein
MLRVFRRPAYSNDLASVAGPREGGLHDFLLVHTSRMERLNTAGAQVQTDHPKLSLSLLRALMILRFLSVEGGGQPLHGIARGVEATTSTTHRYLKTFKRIGLIEQAEGTRAYRLATPRASKTRGQSASRGQPASIALNDEQVEDVLRSITREQRQLRGFLVGRAGRLERLGPLRDRNLPDDLEISRSLLRALLILRYLFLKDDVQPLFAIAPAVGLANSTTHRYLATLKHVKLVEQIEATQEYRIATPVDT